MAVDLEELVGPGCYELIRRIGGAFSCLWLGSLTGVVGIIVGMTGRELAGGAPLAEALPEPEPAMLLGGPIPLLSTVAGIGVIPLLLATYFLFVRNDAGTPRRWLAFSALSGLLWLVAFGTEEIDDWTPHEFLALGLAAAVWLGINGSFAMVGFFVANRQSQSQGSHLMRIGMENENRRARLAARRAAARAQLEAEQQEEDRDDKPGR